jgi:hypothetical protein
MKRTRLCVDRVRLPATPTPYQLQNKRVARVSTST